MKCTHCGSTEVISIQGQNFCISCGRIVSAEAAATSKKGKRGVGRPRKGPLDMPTPVTVAQLASGGGVAMAVAPKTQTQTEEETEPETTEETTDEPAKPRFSKFYDPSQTSDTEVILSEPEAPAPAKARVRLKAEAEVRPEKDKIQDEEQSNLAPQDEKEPEPEPKPRRKRKIIAPTTHVPVAVAEAVAPPTAADPSAPAAPSAAPTEPPKKLVPRIDGLTPPVASADETPKTHIQQYLLHWQGLISGSMQAAGAPRLLLFTLPAGLAAGGALTVALLNGLFDPASYSLPLQQTTLRAGLEVASLAVAAAALGDWALLVGIYRQGGEFDRRLQHPERWGRAGLSTYARLILLDAFWALTGILLLAGIAAIGLIGFKNEAFPEALALPAVAAVAVLLLIAASLIRAARNLAIPAIVLGNLGLREAMHVSRVLMSSYLDLSAKATLALTTAVSITVGALVVAFDHLPIQAEIQPITPHDVPAALVAGALVTLIVTLSLAARAGWLETAYRQLVLKLMPAQSTKLLTGRRSDHPPFWSSLFFAACVAGPLAAIIALELVVWSAR